MISLVAQREGDGIQHVLAPRASAFDATDATTPGPTANPKTQTPSRGPELVVHLVRGHGLDHQARRFDEEHTRREGAAAERDWLRARKLSIAARMPHCSPDGRASEV